MSKHELHVVGAGFPRTGTYSLQNALDELGYKCYHMKEALDHPKDFDDWYELCKLSPEERKNWNWDRIFEARNYTAAVDSPTSDYWELIYNFYNEKKKRRLSNEKDKDKDKNSNDDSSTQRVKVILTIRDNPDVWYQSVMNTVYEITNQNKRWFSKLMMGSKFIRCVDGIIWNGTFEGKFLEKEFAVEKYLERIEAVKKNVPSEDLLIFNVKQGWEPLCRFLRKEVPIDPNTGLAMPFPAFNSTDDFQKRTFATKRMNDVANFVVGAVAIGTIVGVAYFWKQ